MAQQNDQFKKIIAHCKEYGFIYQSSEVYDGLSAVYDYGPLWIIIKKQHQGVLVEVYGSDEQ